MFNKQEYSIHSLKNHMDPKVEGLKSASNQIVQSALSSISETTFLIFNDNGAAAVYRGTSIKSEFPVNYYFISYPTL